MSFAERTRFEFLRSFGVDLPDGGTGTTGPGGSKRDEPPRQRVDSEIGQEPEFVRSRNGLSRSSGAGKTIVVDADEPSSSSVCR